VSDCKDFIEGIANGDLKKVAVSGSLVSMYSLPGACTSVKLSNTAYTTGAAACKAAALGSANTMMKNHESNSTQET